MSFFGGCKGKKDLGGKGFPGDCPTGLHHDDVICSVYSEVLQVEALTLTFEVIDLLLQGKADQVW